MADSCPDCDDMGIIRDPMFNTFQSCPYCGAGETKAKENKQHVEKDIDHDRYGWTECVLITAIRPDIEHLLRQRAEFARLRAEAEQEHKRRGGVF